MDRHPHLRGPTWRGRGGSLDGLHSRHGRATAVYRDGLEEPVLTTKTGTYTGKPAVAADETPADSGQTPTTIEEVQP